jgi:chaperonin GroES
MKIRPLYDKVVVKIDRAEKTAGGLFIPDSVNKEKPQEAVIIAVGQGKRNEDGKLLPLDVKVGDRILFGKYSGNEIKIDDEEFLILREDEIIGVVEGSAKKK